MRRELLAVAVFAALTLLPSASGAAAALGVDLLENGDAETGDTTGWATSGIEAFDDAGRIQSGTFFFWGGTAPTATATQEIDVSALAATIAGGDVIATLSGRLGGFSTQADHASVAVAELDGTGAVLDTFQIGPVTDTERGNATQMLLRRATTPLDPATRSLRVTLTATRFEGTNNDGSFDDLSLVLSDGPPAVTAGANLLENGDAETGTGSTATSGSRVPVAGWESTGSFTIVQYGTGNFPDDAEGVRVDGGDDFFAGGPGSAVATASQTVDVSAISTLIDAGEVDATVAALIGGFSTQEDRGQLDAIYRDASGAELARQTLGPVTEADRGSQTRLEPRSATGVLPAGTRSIEVLLTATRSSGTANDGYFDNVSLALDFTLPASRNLTVTTIGPGAVTSLPAGISCGTDCSEVAADGTTFTLTAVPSSGGGAASWSGCDTATGVTCTVALGADRTVTAVFAAPTAAPVAAVAAAAEPALPNLRLALSSTGATVNETATIRAHVANVGPAAAVRARLAGHVPAQVFAASATTGDCAIDAGQLLCELGTLAAGASAEVTLSLASETAGTVPFAARVSTISADLDPSDDAADTTVSFLAGATADLAFTLVEATESAGTSVGTQLVARLANRGPDTAKGVELRLAGDYGMVAGSIVAPDASCTTAVDTHCELGPLAPGEEIEITARGRMPPFMASAFVKPGLLLRASSDTQDASLGNELVVARVAFVPLFSIKCVETYGPVTYVNCARVGIETVADRAAVVPGDEVTFRTTAIVRAWAGMGPTGIGLAQGVPPGTELVSASSPNGSCAVTGSTVQCSLTAEIDEPVAADVTYRVVEHRRIVHRTAVLWPYHNGGATTEVVLEPCAAVGTEAGETLRSRFPGDSICGLGGDDTIVLAHPAFASGGPGADSIVASAAAVVDGGEDGDSIVGSPGNDSIQGGLGADTISGGGGRDLIRGDAGADVLLGSADRDEIHGGDGADTIDGNGGNDRVFGGDGDDRIDLSDAEASAEAEGDGGPGRDRLVGRSGAILRGGDGQDVLLGRTGGVSLTLEGGDSSDSITGGDVLDGGLGNDTLVGDGRSQTLRGGPGHDHISGGLGSDLLDGGQGSDTLVGDGSLAAALIGGTPMSDTIEGGDGRDRILGGPGADTLRGGLDPDRIEGGSGNDVIEGDEERDVLYGGTGDDVLHGGGGDDVVYGEEGHDSLRGGAGADDLRPGAGVDAIEAHDDVEDRIRCGSNAVDGPVLVDLKDEPSGCRSVFAYRLRATSGYGYDGFCALSVARANVKVTYSNVVGSGEKVVRVVQLPGAPTAPWLHWLESWDTFPGGDGAFVVRVAVEHQGRTMESVETVPIVRFSDACND